MPLTADRAKPAVPFGGTYRLIDFVLSNLVNSDLRRIAVLTQYKSHSLDRHISLTWRMSELTRFDSTKSMSRYVPPNGTAGLARSAVSGINRLPSPPASTMDSAFGLVTMTTPY